MSMEVSSILSQIPDTWLGSPLSIAGTLLIVSLVLEDLALALGLYFISIGSMTASAAFTILAAVTMIGDVALYALGRWVSTSNFVKNVKSRNNFIRVERILKNNTLFALWFSRAVPGLRLPTYTAAGLFRLDFKKFSFLIFLACIVWVGVFIFCGNSVTNFIVIKTGLPSNLAIFIIFAVILLLQFAAKNLFERKIND